MKWKKLYVSILWRKVRIRNLLRLAQKRDMKSPVVMRSTDVASAFNINLKQRPISFLLILLTAQISLNVRGTPSCRHAMYKQADAFASFERPFKFLPSCTCLNKLFARSTMVFGKFIRSAIVEISLNAAMSARSELLMVRRFWYFAATNINWNSVIKVDWVIRCSTYCRMHQKMLVQCRGRSLSINRHRLAMDSPDHQHETDRRRIFHC